MATSSDTGTAAPRLWSGAFPAGSGPAVLVHGGAWDIPADEAEAHREGLLLALARVERLLARRASAVDVAAETVAVLEAHPAFDAGRGAVLDRDGQPQLDAGIMDGASLAWGAVANVRRLPHPVRLARHLLAGDAQARLLVAEGAERYAAEHGFAAVELARLVVPRERERYAQLARAAGYHTSQTFAGEGSARAPVGDEGFGKPSPRGTVGCVVRDGAGRLAAATSTGGTPFAPSGRVGDSPLPGAGFYADGTAALSATGWGEAIAAVALCARAGLAVGGGASPEAAARSALAEMGAVAWPGAAHPAGGLIVIAADGGGAWAFSTPRMARGGWRPGEQPWAAVDPPGVERAPA